jgi:hypothetical protein
VKSKRPDKQTVLASDFTSEEAEALELASELRERVQRERESVRRLRNYLSSGKDRHVPPPEQ